MKHPKSANAHILADTFQMLSLDRQNVCDMGNTKFNACGTVACHAGWFAVANNKSRAFRVTAPDGKYYGFNDAADEMARFLGFQGQICLLDWASGNPELWGNKNGGVMFSSDSAFGKSTSKNVISLKEISNHWRKVAERLEKIERQYDNHVKDTVAKYR